MTSICEYLNELKNFKLTRIILYPRDHQVEVDVNTWAMALGHEDALSDIDKIVAHLKMVMYRWTRANAGIGNAYFKQRLKDPNYPREKARQATFYAWTGDSAEGLKVSLTSLPMTHLPFGTEVKLLDSPRPLIERLFESKADPSYVPHDQFIPRPESEWYDSHGEFVGKYRFVVHAWAVTHTW